MSSEATILDAIELTSTGTFKLGSIRARARMSSNATISERPSSRPRTRSRASAYERGRARAGTRTSSRSRARSGLGAYNCGRARTRRTRWRPRLPAPGGSAPACCRGEGGRRLVSRKGEDEGLAGTRWLRACYLLQAPVGCRRHAPPALLVSSKVRRSCSSCAGSCLRKRRQRSSGSPSSPALLSTGMVCTGPPDAAWRITWTTLLASPPLGLRRSTRAPLVLRA